MRQIFTQNCQKLLLFLCKMWSFKYYLIFHHIFVFHKESISGFHDFKQKSGHRTNSWSGWGKSLTKICQNVLYSYIKTQPNADTTPLVSLDNSSTLTILDLFVVHSCFQKQTYWYIWIRQKFTICKGWLLFISLPIFIF